MSKTNQSVFPQNANVGQMNVLLSTAMTAAKAFEGTDATGTALALLATANATEGSRLDAVIINYAGTTGAAPSGTSNATVLRLFLNSGGVNTTAANNSLVTNIPIPAQLYTNTAKMPVLVVPVNISIPAGYKVYAGLTTAMGGTNCAVAVLPVMGDYA